MSKNKEQRIGRQRENRSTYSKEEMESWYKAVEECAKAGTERMKKIRTEYEFNIVIHDADFDDLNDHDKLFDSGCDDALICALNNTVYLKFTRESDSEQNAINSAINNIKNAGFSDIEIYINKRGK